MYYNIAGPENSGPVKIIIMFRKLFFLIIVSGFFCISSAQVREVEPGRIRDLVCFWNFEKLKGPWKAVSGKSYWLREGASSVKSVEDGLWNNRSVLLMEGQWLYIPAEECSALNICGKNAQISVVAWIKRKKKKVKQCEAVAGMWNETDKKRQYGLFLNLGIWNSRQQVGGHISGVGGPTNGYKYCMDAAIGQSQVPLEVWQCIGMTYDGCEIRVYLNGVLDRREKQNPYYYDKGIFCVSGSKVDFTVGAVNRSGEMGNFFVGQISGIAVYNRALDGEEMRYLSSNILSDR